MSLKFCANLSFMFQEEASLLKRYALASACGFKAVECAWPYDFSTDELIRVKNEGKLHQIMINTPVCKEEPGKFGLASVSSMEKEFMEGFKKSVKYARALDCRFIHIMSGTVISPDENNYETYLTNLKSAVKILEMENLIGLIEPINKYSVPNYYMNCYDKAVDIIKQVKSDHLKLMLDIFHLQQIKGNLSRSIEELMPYVGHIQIAQVPHRHEPDTCGEIDFRYILKLIQSSGFEGWIGLEYKPQSSSAEGLSWIEKFGYCL